MKRTYEDRKKMEEKAKEKKAKINSSKEIHKNRFKNADKKIKDLDSEE